jgi:hypothetical protein
VPELSTEVRIFLSSTFVDLQELRAEVATRLREVFGARLLTMETFGSDEAPPEISSVRRVRECDIFVGIYARRYGTVDRTTGKSITELELDEAERSLSAGVINGILLYVLAADADWPPTESDPSAAARLSALKDHARLHTYCEFRRPSELPFLIIRDVLGRIRDRLSASPFRPRQVSLPQERRLERPVGMTFLTSADRRHFYGREEKVRELLQRVDADPITLLLGNSGSGKTSLIHAGLFPAISDAGWFPVYARPLGLPRSDVVSSLLSSVFDGPHSYRGTLVAPLEQAATAIAPRRLLLVIDQFEDILTARDGEEGQRLVADLRTVRFLDDREIRVILSYRADLEARLGHYWQQISGSPEGLGRVYLGGISPGEAWKSIESACSDLNITLELSEDEKSQIRADLTSFSAAHGEDGVYPPYVQMLVDHAWRHVGNRPGVYTFNDYHSAGAMEGVTGGYLARQLTYAHDTDGSLKSVLVSLVRSYGVRAQKSLPEIAADTGMGERDCEVALEKLIDLRLVRHVADLYEVAHDFLAREIAAKLVDSEEREFKRVRELLSSKAATYETTRSLLTSEELLMIFKYKDRILASDAEVRLVLASWIRNEGPGLHCLLRAQPSKIAELIRAEESEDDIEDENRAILALLRCKVTNSALTENDWPLFRLYRLGLELSAILSSAPFSCPDSFLESILLGKHRTAREAALEAVARKIANGDATWIDRLSRTSSTLKKTAYERLIACDSLQLFPIDPATGRSFREFGLLQRIARSQSRSEVWSFLRDLRRGRPRARTWLLARDIAAYRTSGFVPFLRKLHKLSAAKLSTLMNSIPGTLSQSDFRVLLEVYVHWNKKEAESINGTNPRLRVIYEDKASTLAMTILRTAEPTRDLELLRDLFPSIVLTPSAQYYVQALVRLGNSPDIVGIVNSVEQANHVIHYWFQIELGRIVEKRMWELNEVLPSELVGKCGRRGFWEDLRGQRRRVPQEDLLPLRDPGNHALYLRLVVHALIGAARGDNIELLKQLAQHEFRMIARAAAIQLVRLAGDVGIRELQAAVTPAIERRNGEAFGLAVRDAEIQRFGVAELW